MTFTQSPWKLTDLFPAANSPELETASWETARFQAGTS